MLTSAIVLSKDSMTKRFKPRCLCYWLVDSLYFKNWLKGNQKLRKTKIHFFLSCKFLYSAIMWVNNPLWKHIYWQNMRLGIEKNVLKKTSFRAFLRSFRIFFPGFSKWTSDCLWAMTRNRFLQQGSQDNWYFSIYMFTSSFILKIFSSYINPVY